MRAPPREKTKEGGRVRRKISEGRKIITVKEGLRPGRKEGRKTYEAGEERRMEMN